MLYINIHLFLKAFLSYIWVGEWYIKGYGSLNPWPSGLENSNLPCFLVHKPTLGDRTRFFPPFFGVSLYCGPTAAESHDIFDQSRCPKVATLQDSWAVRLNIGIFPGRFNSDFCDVKRWRWHGQSMTWCRKDLLRISGKFMNLWQIQLDLV